MYGMIVYRGHLIARSDNERHPETGKLLYSISELKPALTPPLLTSQEECKEYIKELEPYTIENRIDAYGFKRRDYARQHHNRRNRSAQKMEAYYGRTCAGYET